MDGQGSEKKVGHEKGEIMRLESFLLLWVQHMKLYQLCGIDTELKEKFFTENLWTKREVWLLFYMEKCCDI